MPISKDLLECNDWGRPLSTGKNFLTIVRFDKFFNGLKFNEMLHIPEYEIDGKTKKWTDEDDAMARIYIESTYGLRNASKLDDALRLVFAENRYNPLKELIKSFEWDKKSRIYDFLHKCAKCDDNEYTKEVSRLIFSGGIHRLFNAGCKFDSVPVLIGSKQGEGKSTLIRWLALSDDYYSEVTVLEGQKGIESIEGAWICELSELLAFTKAKDAEVVKAYITRQNDRYRRPFDKRVSDHFRQCIFIGTTNKELFLTDKTGNRRFFPVKVYQNGYELYAHKEEIQEYIRQCWAEAYVLYNNNELVSAPLSLLSDIIEQNQQASMEDDYRDGLIADYLKDKSEICVLELWSKALGNPYPHYKPTKKDSNEIATILQSMPEWEKQNTSKRFRSYGVQKWWKNKKFEWCDEAEKVSDM